MIARTHKEGVLARQALVGDSDVAGRAERFFAEIPRTILDLFKAWPRARHTSGAVKMQLTKWVLRLKREKTGFEGAAAGRMSEALMQAPDWPSALTLSLPDASNPTDDDLEDEEKVAAAALDAHDELQILKWTGEICTELGIAGVDETALAEAEAEAEAVGPRVEWWKAEASLGADEPDEEEISKSREVGDGDGDEHESVGGPAEEVVEAGEEEGVGAVLKDGV